MASVVAIGEALIDFTTERTDAEGYPVMAAHAGGAPANFLATLAKYGVSSALITKVGEDTFGHLLKGTLQAAGIDTHGVRMDKAFFTTLAFVTLDAAGERTFAFARKPGADTQLRYEELDLSMIDQAQVLHFGTLSLTHEPARTATKNAVEYARQNGKLITFDPNLRLPLWEDPEEAKRQMQWGLRHADIVKISLEEIEFLFDCMDGEGAEKCLVDYGAKLVFVTLGKQGAYFATRKCTGYVQNFNGVHTVDTTGAGDIFGASALCGILESGEAPQNLTRVKLQEITRFACAAASLSTEQHGGIASIPARERVEALLAQ